MIRKLYEELAAQLTTVDPTTALAELQRAIAADPSAAFAITEATRLAGIGGARPDEAIPNECTPTL